MGWPTAQTVLAQAAVELGLVGSPDDLGDNAYDSTDSNIVQLRALLKKAGRDLVDEYDWEQLRAEWAITTLAGDFGVDAAQRTGVYVLPKDWHAMLPQTGWNRTNRLPMGGALSEQEWQYLASRLTGVVWTILFKPRQGMVWLYPSTSTPAGQEIVFVYKSENWVRPSALVEGIDYGTWVEDADVKVGMIVAAGSSGDPFNVNLYRCVQPGHTGRVADGGPDPALTETGVPTLSGSIYDGQQETGGAYWNWIGTIVQTTNALGTETISTPSFATKTEPEAGDDVLLFDEQLLVAKLKFLWLDAKGFDSSQAEIEYGRQFGSATSNSESPPILSLNGGGIVRDRLLSELNVPITGFGS
jgi:hypothetical protein